MQSMPPNFGHDRPTLATCATLAPPADPGRQGQPWPHAGLPPILGGRPTTLARPANLHQELCIGQARQLWPPMPAQPSWMGQLWPPPMPANFGRRPTLPPIDATANFAGAIDARQPWPANLGQGNGLLEPVRGPSTLDEPVTRDWTSKASQQHQAKSRASSYVGQGRGAGLSTG